MPSVARVAQNLVEKLVIILGQNSEIQGHVGAHIQASSKIQREIEIF